MKHLLRLTLFLGLVWGQVRIGTGLELNDISDFIVICETPNSDGERIGLSKKSIEAKVKLALRGNGTPSKGKKGSPYLYINIFVREDNTTSGKSLGHSISIELSFHRIVTYLKFGGNYATKMPEYATTGITWNLPEENLAIPASYDTKSEIMQILLEMVDQFSIALLEANEK